MVFIRKINFVNTLIIILLLYLINYENVSAEQGIKIYADSINIDEANEQVSAFGEAIAVNETKVKIKSDKLVYDRYNKTLEAEGNVIVNDEIDNTFFLEKMTSTSDLNNIQANKVKIRLNDDSRIVGTNFVKDNEISIIENTEFTPCKEGNYLIKNCPGWKLKSKRIYHDNKTKTIYYDHARIHLFNVPVFYLPHFSHPDPSVRKRSGFLMPTIQTDNLLGDTFSIPVFFNISSNKDLTFTPNLQSKSNNFYSLNYRHLNDKIRLNVDASIDDNNDNSGTSNHLFVNSEVFNSYGKLNAYLQTSNNDTYMRKEKINNFTILKSGIDFEREKDDTFFSFESVGYKHLTTQDRQWEYLYPSIKYNIDNIKNRIFDGNLSLNNRLSFRKDLSENYHSLASSQLDWTNQIINKSFGIIASNEANLRITSISIDEKSSNDTNNIRIYPQLSSKISYPLLKTSSSVNQTLTPIVMPIIAPYNNYTSVQTITNSNLFSSNRATSITEWEGGPRINYGVEWFVNSEQGIDLKTTISQNYRFNKDNSETDNEASHYFINSNFNMNSGNYLDSSLIIDRKDHKIRSLSAHSLNEVNDIIIAINYDYTSGTYQSPEEQVAVGGKYTLERNLFLKFTGSKDLDKNKNIGYQYGILYENDCLGIDFNYYRDLTKDRDVEESEGISFTIVLKPFGSTNNYGKNIVFGPRI